MQSSMARQLILAWRWGRKLTNFQLAVIITGKGFPADGQRNVGMGLQIMNTARE